MTTKGTYTFQLDEQQIEALNWAATFALGHCGPGAQEVIGGDLAEFLDGRTESTIIRNLERIKWGQ